MSGESDDAILAEAVARFAARHGGAWSARSEARLQAWLEGDSRRRAAFERLEGVWADAGGLAGRVSYGMTPRRGARWRPVAALGAVAVLAAVLVLPSLHFWERGRAEAPRTLQTASGIPAAYQLGDGTRVDLDAGSALTVRFSADRRELTLLRGEATVDVARDAARPLVMNAGGGTITDRGTRFDVEVLDSATRVTVFEGRVEVRTGRETLSLSAGQRGGYDATGKVEPVVAIAQATPAGFGHRRRFDNEPLGRVLERLRRYHTAAITLADPGLATLPVSGTFGLNDLPLFLRTLEAALPVTVRWVDDQHVLIGGRVDLAR